MKTKWKDTVKEVDQLLTENNWDDNGGFTHSAVAAALEKQAEISFEAGTDIGYQRGLAMKPNPGGVYENGKKDGIKEVIDYFFYEAGLVRLMGCSTMEEFKAKLIGWQAKLKRWGL